MSVLSLEEVFTASGKTLASLQAAIEIATEDEIESLREAQRLSECGFFVLLFSVLETWIDNLFWETRGDPYEFSLMRRVHELFDDSSETAEWIARQYSIRCDIAHGRHHLMKSLNLRDFAAQAKHIMAG